MKISDLIHELSKIERDYGDIDLCTVPNYKRDGYISSNTKVFADVELKVVVNSVNGQVLDKYATIVVTGSSYPKELY